LDIAAELPVYAHDHRLPVTVADPAESRLRAAASLKLAIMDLDARSTGPLR
jgi:hypothetical protein